MLAWLTKAWNAVTNFPWIKVVIFSAVVGALVYEVNLIYTAGQKDQAIKELQTAIVAQKKVDDAAIADLKAQYVQDTAALSQERDNALKIATDRQKILDSIEKAPNTDNGPVRPILLNTLNLLRANPAGNGS